VYYYGGPRGPQGRRAPQNNQKIFPIMLRSWNVCARFSAVLKMCGLLAFLLRRLVPPDLLLLGCGRSCTEAEGRCDGVTCVASTGRCGLKILVL
jgi:hypothetical protein